MRLHIAVVILSLVPALANAEPSVERGEYLVRGPAGCGNCHTPQTPDGPDMSNELGGFMVEKNPAFEAWAVNMLVLLRVVACLCWGRRLATDGRLDLSLSLLEAPSVILLVLSASFLLRMG